MRSRTMGGMAPLGPLDRLGRPLGDLRISVTDRCNFRCGYCMPKAVFGADHVFLPRTAILEFEEIALVARAAVRLGVRKIRLTGGEPLLRRELAALVRMLAPLEGLEDLALTTNGAALAPLAAELADAGLRRVTVSLDALDDATFRALNDVDFPVDRVLGGIDAAVRAGLAPIKVNMVVQRGRNEADIVPMARHFRGRGIVLRFIEFMDVGTTNGWKPADVVPAAEIVARLEAAGLGLVPLPASVDGEVARRYGYRDGAGEIGVVSSVTQPFCRSCNRLRLSADGRFYLCLFATEGHDVKSMLRAGATEAEVEQWLAALWSARMDRYSEVRHATGQSGPRVEMSFIGG